MYDLLIKNGIVVDGTGAKRQYADVAVEGKRIAKIAPVIDAEAKQVIDAEGLFVTPGFIDVHSHADSLVVKKNDSQNFLRQGITTQFMGQCGSSPVPFEEKAHRRDKEAMTPEAYEDMKAKLSTPTAFMKAAETQEYSLNPCFLIGHKGLRVKALGYGDEAPTDAQMGVMKSILNEAMEAGYFGYSTGLVYAPSVYAKTDELIELAKELTKYDGIYASHIRGEGIHVEDAVSEAIAIGAAAKIRVLVSHLKVLGDINKGKGAKLLKLIDDANARGERVYADQYSWDGSSAHLIWQIPPKYLTKGVDGAIEILKDTSVRKKIEDETFNDLEHFEASMCYSGYDKTLISAAPGCPQYVGKTLAEIAKEKGITPFDAYCEVVIDTKGDATGIYINQDIMDISTIMSHPYVFCGCDALDYHYKDPETVGSGHPRSNATFTKRLEIIRDLGLNSAEFAIAQMTGTPAEKLGFAERGLLKEGMYADICVFDWKTVGPTCDYMHPYRPNKGISYVIVNGEIVVDHDVMTGARPGMLIKPVR